MLPIDFLHHPKSEQITLGHTGRFPLLRPLKVDLKTRASHTYVVGVSGKGKSKLLESLLYQDIAAGRGVGLIDPHSQLASDLLRILVTKNLTNDPNILAKIIYVDPARTDYVIPFNVLAAAGEEPYDIATSVVEAFRRTWPLSLQEAPHFTNVIMAALLVLIANKLTLMDMPRLLTNKEYRESCLKAVNDHSVIEFFHDRFDRWGREAPLMRESVLNKIGAFNLNPRLKLMLGQKANHLNFREIMDEGKILILDLGRCDTETNRLIGSLVVTGLEMAMRRRTNDRLWNLTIDEFAGYVANEGSAKTLAHVLSEGRKFRMSMTVAHQNLSQLTEKIIGAISNVQTKVIFGVGRYDAEYLAKLVGKVNPEEVKRDPKTTNQHELFTNLMEQWEGWIDEMRFQPDRKALVSVGNKPVQQIQTLKIPTYTATEVEVEEVRIQSVYKYGVLYDRVMQNLCETRSVSAPSWQLPKTPIPAYEIIE